jgi:peptide/nickel transport system ATP-binding protein
MERIILQGDVPSPVNPPPGCYFHPRCPYAKDKCKEETPPFVNYGDEHYAACHFASELKLKGVRELEAEQRAAASNGAKQAAAQAASEPSAGSGEAAPEDAPSGGEAPAG